MLRSNSSDGSHLDASDSPLAGVAQLSTDRLPHAVIGATAVGMLFELVRLLRRGFDITDESSYVNAIASPDAFPLYHTHFGYFYHPLHWATDGNIYAMRVVTILAIVTLCSATAFLLMSGAAAQARDHLGRASRLALSIAFGFGSMAMLNFWLPTPNYNTLAMQGILLVSTGVVVAVLHGSRARASIAASALLGLGGFVVFMAKPTTAAAMSILSLGILLVAPIRWRVIAGGGLIALLLVLGTLVAIDGNIMDSKARLSSSAAVLSALDAGHGKSHLLRMDDLLWSNSVKLVFLSVLVGTMFMVTVFCLAFRRAAVVRLVAVGVLCLTAILLLAELIDVPATYGPFQGTWLLAVALAVVAVVAIRGFRHGGLHWRYVSLAAYFSALPYAYAFGSNNNYWKAGSLGGVFWALAALAMMMSLRGQSRTGSTALAALVLVVTAMVVQGGLVNPYRQAVPLRDMDSVVQFGASERWLYTSNKTSRLMAGWRQRAIDSDMPPGTLLIDLTGRSPAAALATGARPAGWPWILGGYPGSMTYAGLGLAREKCTELARAWILAEDAGPRRVPVEVLHHFDLDLYRDYERLGVVAGSSSNHYMYKPRRDLAARIRNCV